MAPVFNQALKAGHVGFVTDTYIQCISSSLLSLKNVLTEDNLGGLVQQWCMQQKMHLLNVNNIGQNMGEEIYSITQFNTL